MDWTKLKTLTLEELIDYLKNTKYKSKTLYDYLSFDRTVEYYLRCGLERFNNNPEAIGKPDVGLLYISGCAEHIPSCLYIGKVAAVHYVTEIGERFDTMREFCKENEEQNFLQWFIKTE